MIVNLYREHNLRGYMLEYAARVILRREEENNFLFLTSRFDSLNEILTKYKLKISDDELLKRQLDLFHEEWKRIDIIEFILNNKQERIVEGIKIFEVKSKFKGVNRKYFEMCVSGAKFLKKCLELNIPSFIVSIIVLEKWMLGFNVYPYEPSKIREYSNFKKIV